MVVLSYFLPFLISVFPLDDEIFTSHIYIKWNVTALHFFFCVFSLLVLVLLLLLLFSCFYYFIFICCACVLYISLCNLNISRKD